MLAVSTAARSHKPEEEEEEQKEEEEEEEEEEEARAIGEQLVLESDCVRVLQHTF